jgi:hypothetical protein
MNTLRFSAFGSKKEYNRFMRKVKQNQPQDDKLHIADCSCGNGHLTINSAETISGYRVVNNGGLIHFIDPNGMPCSKEQFDRIMGETQ